MELYWGVSKTSDWTLFSALYQAAGLQNLREPTIHGANKSRQPASLGPKKRRRPQEKLGHSDFTDGSTLSSIFSQLGWIGGRGGELPVSIN